MKQIQKEEGQVLLLDIGDLFPGKGFGQKLVGELSLKAMNQMGYAAMNLGWNELSTGTETLKEMTAEVTFPLIASNLVDKNNQQTPFVKKYIIRQIGDVSVGIIGIIPPESPEDILNAKGCSQKQSDKDDKEISAGTPLTLFLEQLEVIPPEDALKDILPEIRKQANLVILLSQYPFETTREIVKNIEGIDLAISAPGKRRIKTDEEKDTGVPVMQVFYGGRNLGYVKLFLDEKGKIIQKQEKMIPLNDQVSSDEQIVKITGDDIYKRLKEEEKKKIEEERKALLKLSPYEYYERIMKQQSEIGGKK